MFEQSSFVEFEVKIPWSAVNPSKENNGNLIRIAMCKVMIDLYKAAIERFQLI